jgi:DNA-directed RNA polymerase subunit M/transcription elongation factor TFIIS
MSTIRFCTDCESLLDDLNISNGKFYCGACHKEFDLPDNDKTFMKFFAGEKKKTISTEDCFRMSHMPATNRINKTCPSCKFEIMTCINDGDYNFSFTCLKCKKTFR